MAEEELLRLWGLVIPQADCLPGRRMEKRQRERERHAVVVVASGISGKANTEGDCSVSFAVVGFGLISLLIRVILLFSSSFSHFVSFSTTDVSLSLSHIVSFYLGGGISFQPKLLA